MKPSASAKLLQAVKMKDKAACSETEPVAAFSTSKAAISAGLLSATPPSHSSLIYGSISPTTALSTAVSAPQATLPPLQSCASSVTASTAVTATSSTAVTSTSSVGDNVSTSHIVHTPVLVSLPSAPLDMRLQSYKSIAPAPPPPSSALTNPPASLFATTVDTKDEDEEQPLVIAEVCDEMTLSGRSNESCTTSADQTTISEEVNM